MCFHHHGHDVLYGAIQETFWVISRFWYATNDSFYMSDYLSQEHLHELDQEFYDHELPLADLRVNKLLPLALDDQSFSSDRPTIFCS